MASLLDVAVVSCGAPKRGMGWYHCKQLLEGRVEGARLSDVVEPFLLSKGADSEAGRSFAEFSRSAPVVAAGVAFHKSLGEMPVQKGPKLAIICGRTADNPQLFREAVDRGLTHIYLEKPGAPSTKELEEMAAYAKQKGVPIFMGYNRNFSKYVRLACDAFAKQGPGRATMTLGRNDCFPEAALDECFERNAEGMMKNMMCHELVVLLTYYGLTVDGIRDVVADQQYTHSETRGGFKDFRRVGFTIRTKAGQKFKLWGDRCGGEYGEAVVTVAGEEVFKAVRPDAEIETKAQELEAAEPGCMPYFYLQDGEYIALKSAVVDHVRRQASGLPVGVASIDTAIEGLKVCDLITQALMAPKETYSICLSNHPSSWGVDYADCPTNPPWDGVLRCIAESGFAGTELGPVGYYQADRLGPLLKQHKLQLVAGNIFEKLHEPDEVPGILEKTHASCKILKEYGARFFTIVPHIAEERVSTAGRPAEAQRLSDGRWKQLMEAIVKVAEVVKSYGIQCTLHPHSGAWIETEDEIDRAMADLPADLVYLCLDVGHCAYACMDPVAVYKRYASRTPFLHFKDIDGAVLKGLQEQKKGFWDGVSGAVFCPLGHGVVDFPALLRAMKTAGFSGWVTVEQDFCNNIPDVEARLQKPFECCKLNVKYLQSLGVVDSSSKPATADSYTGRFDGSQAKHASPAMAAMAGKGGAGDSEAEICTLPTSTKWSVLSSRMEGLVAELSQLVSKQDAYCVSHSRAEGRAMCAVREKMLSTPWAKEWESRRTMFSYGEEMSTDPLEAVLLKQLVFMAKPRRVLEVGMFVGYGAVAMLEGSPSMQLVSLEIDPYLKDWLASCLTEAGCGELTKRHEVVLGPALESLPKLTGQFDMVFVDANKAEYKAYVEGLLERNLLAAGGVIICDNILYNGYPYMHEHFDAQPARRNFGNAIKEFNQWVSDHPVLEQVVLPVRDGISILRRSADSPLPSLPSQPAAAASGSPIPGVKAYYTFPPAPNAMMVDIFLREKGVGTQQIQSLEKFIDLPSLENRSAECLKMNPQGSLPWFVLDDGTVIAETIAMCEYVEEVMPQPCLVGAGAKQRGVVRQWQRRMEEHYCYPAFYGHRNWTASSDCAPGSFMKDFFAQRLNAHHGAHMLPEAWKDLCTWAKNRILWLERVKKEQQPSSLYIAGDQFTVVDVQVYVTMWFFSEAFPHPPQRILQELQGQVPWVQAWFDRVHARPAVVAAREYREKNMAEKPTAQSKAA